MTKKKKIKKKQTKLPKWAVPEQPRLRSSSGFHVYPMGICNKCSVCAHTLSFNDSVFPSADRFESPPSGRPLNNGQNYISCHEKAERDTVVMVRVCFGARAALVHDNCHRNKKWRKSEGGKKSACMWQSVLTPGSSIAQSFQGMSLSILSAKADT